MPQATAIVGTLRGVRAAGVREYTSIPQVGFARSGGLPPP